MNVYEHYRQASRVRVLSFLAGLANRACQPVAKQAYLAELVGIIAFGVAHADFVRLAA